MVLGFKDFTYGGTCLCYVGKDFQEVLADMRTKICLEEDKEQNTHRIVARHLYSGLKFETSNITIRLRKGEHVSDPNAYTEEEAMRYIYSNNAKVVRDMLGSGYMFFEIENQP